MAFEIEDMHNSAAKLQNLQQKKGITQQQQEKTYGMKQLGRNAGIQNRTKHCHRANKDRLQARAFGNRWTKSGIR